MADGNWVDARISWGFNLFQGRVATWVRNTFGEAADDKKERALRFLEEALELVQAVGLDRDAVHRLVDYVFARKPGDVYQEIGGAMVTLSALTTAHDALLGNLASITLDDIEKPETIQRCLARQEEKRAAGVTSDAATAEVEWRDCDKCDGKDLRCRKCAGSGKAAYVNGRLV